MFWARRGGGGRWGWEIKIEIVLGVGLRGVRRVRGRGGGRSGGRCICGSGCDGCVGIDGGFLMGILYGRRRREGRVAVVAFVRR